MGTLQSSTHVLAHIADHHFSKPVRSIARAKHSGVRFFSGTEQVLSQHVLLQELAEAHGMSGELDQLPYVLREGIERGKRPYLLLFESRAGNPNAAALFHAYEIAGRSTRIFMPIDFGGGMNVIAPHARRKAIAFEATRHLFRRGALMVLTSVVGEDFSREAAMLDKKRACAVQVRPISEKFLLKGTVDETLATLGAHTRRNLRYYSRRAASELGATFAVNEPVTAAEFLAMNRQSVFATSEAMALWRFKNWNKFEGGFLATLRDKNGRLLSVMGGRASDHLADVDWQMNLSELISFSLSTVMRAHVIEYMVGRGVKVLRFEGGTPHSMSLSFQEERVGDFFLARKPLGRKFVERVIAGKLPADNRFANVFRYNLLEWR